MGSWEPRHDIFRTDKVVVAAADRASLETDTTSVRAQAAAAPSPSAFTILETNARAVGRTAAPSWEPAPPSGTFVKGVVDANTAEVR